MNYKKILNENSNINIIFYNITRFSRNTGQAINFVNKCVSKGIKLHFAEENFTIDHFMDLHRLRLGLSQAEYESNVISNRVRSNNNVLRVKGGNLEDQDMVKWYYLKMVLESLLLIDT